MSKKLPFIDNRCHNYDRIYYLAPLPQQKMKKLIAKARIINFRPRQGADYGFPTWQGPGRFTKEAIERFPKYLRRGGEYGHYDADWSKRRNIKSPIYDDMHLMRGFDGPKYIPNNRWNVPTKTPDFWWDERSDRIFFNFA